MEIIIIFAVLFSLFLILKLLGVLIHTGVFLITLPLKIIFSVLLLLLFIPLGFAGLIVGVFGIIIPLLPFILLAAFVLFLIKNH
jgi:hypothetical protein